MKKLKIIGKNIAHIRKSKRMTQEDLAGLAEMDRSYLSEIENGHKNFSIMTLLKIADVLQVNIGKILTGFKK